MEDRPRVPPCAVPIRCSYAEIDSVSPVLADLSDATFPCRSRGDGARHKFTLPPYAESTVAAFEALNNMRFAADLRFWLTRVSRELIPLHVILLCTLDGLEAGEVGRALVQQRCCHSFTEYYHEAAILHKRGGSDAGRHLRQEKHLDWVYMPQHALTKVWTFPAWWARLREQYAGQADMATLLDTISCDLDRQALDLHVDVANWYPWTGAGVYMQRGLMYLEHIGCTSNARLVMRGPYAGHIEFLFSVGSVAETIILPSFTAFVALAINGGYNWHHRFHAHRHERWSAMRRTWLAVVCREL